MEMMVVVMKGGDGSAWWWWCSSKQESLKNVTNSLDVSLTISLDDEEEEGISHFHSVYTPMWGEEEGGSLFFLSSFGHELLRKKGGGLLSWILSPSILVATHLWKEEVSLFLFYVWKWVQIFQFGNKYSSPLFAVRPLVEKDLNFVYIL